MHPVPRALSALLALAAVAANSAAQASSYSVRAVVESEQDNGTNGFAFVVHNADPNESAAAIARASNGMLRAAATATAYPVPFDPSVTVITQSEAIAFMSLTGFFISGAGGNVPASFNMLLSGNVTATAGGMASAGVQIDLYTTVAPPGQSTFLTSLFGTLVDEGGARSGTGAFAVVPPGSPISLLSNVVMMPVNVPLLLSVSLRTTARAYESGASPQRVDASANFENTLTFPTDGPVFNLPAGYTLESTDGLFVGNRFTGVPLAPGAVFLLTGLAGLFGLQWTKRKKAPVR